MFQDTFLHDKTLCSAEEGTATTEEVTSSAKRHRVMGALTRRDAVSDALLNLGYVGVGRQPDALLSHRNLFSRAARPQHEQPQTTLSNAYQLLSAT